MATKTLEIVVKVRDAAKKPLKKVDKGLTKAGKSAKKAETDFTKFNRTLFTTAAFIGVFVKAFSSAINAMDVGSKLDRVTEQFERTVGGRGELIRQIQSLTDNSIDIMESMRAGIALKTLGIAKDTQQIASLVSKAGTAAKLAGKDSAEGIKSFTEFLKSGNVESLQFLNLIAKTNPELKAQLAILSKSGGVMSGVLTDAQKLALGQKLLTAATKGHLKGERDLRDVILDSAQAFKLFRGELGALLGRALAPLIDKVTAAVFRFTELLQSTKKTDKGIRFLTKTLAVGTTAVLTFAAALGTLRLTGMLLSSVGLGLPALATIVLGLGGTFLGVTSTVEKFTEKLSLLGNFVKGIYQLITSLDEETGIAKIDKEIADLLRKHGLLEFAQDIARVGSLVKKTFEDIIDGAVFVANQVDKFVGGTFRSIINLFSEDKAPWSNWFGDDSTSKIKRWATSALAILGPLAAFFATKGVLSLPGKIFKGVFGGKRGDSPSNPLFVTDVSGIAGGLLGKGKNILGGAGGMLKSVFKGLTKIGGVLLTVLGSLGTVLKAVVTSAIFLKGALTAAAGALGWLVGSKLGETLDKSTQGTTKEGFEGNLIERGIFKIADMLGLESAKKIISAEEALKNLPDPKRKTTTGSIIPKSERPLTAPAFIEDSNQQEELLSSTIGTLSEDKKAAFTAAIAQARAMEGSGGENITKEEWIAIFRTAMDTSDTQRQIANKELKIEQATDTKSMR